MPKPGMLWGKLRNWKPTVTADMMKNAAILGLLVALLLVVLSAGGQSSEECFKTPDGAWEGCLAIEWSNLDTGTPTPGTATPRPTSSVRPVTPAATSTESAAVEPTAAPEATSQPSSDTAATTNGGSADCPSPCVTITDGNGFSIEPVANTTYQCAPGVILDGLGVEEKAFEGGGDNVTIQNCVIQNYDTEEQRCAVDARDTSGWRILNNEIRENATCGLEAGDNSIVRGNNIHHNHQIGVKADNSTNALFENNEVAYNNYEAEFDPYFEAGGSKFVYTSGLTVRGNYFHDNRGPGIWTDGDNINVLIENNRIEYNEQPGIFHEISFAAVIRNNYVEGNGCSDDFNSACPNIFIANSTDVEVYGNTVIMSADSIWNDVGHGILVAENDRDEYISDNIHVHHNDITYIDGGVSGSSVDRPGIVFDNNIYRGVDASSTSWIWDDPVDFEGFREAGQEANGQVIP